MQDIFMDGKIELDMSE